MNFRLVILLFLACLELAVVSLRYDRNGVSIVQELDISLGYSTYFAVTPLDTSWIVDTLTTLAEMTKTMTKKITELSESDSDFKYNEPFWKLQMTSVKRAEVKAYDTFEDLNIFIGNIKDGRHEKRGAWAFVGPILSLAVKVASIIFDVHLTNLESLKVNRFLNYWDEDIQNLDETTDDLITHSQDQVAINRKILNQMSKLETKFEVLEQEINRTQYNLDSKIQLVYLHTSIREGFNDVVNVIENLQGALIQASKGLPLPPFLSVLKVLQIIEDYDKENPSEKSYFREDQILSIYNMAEAQIVRNGDEMAVVNTIRIPTISSRAKLFRLIPFSVFNKTSGLHITVQPKFEFLATNHKSQYTLLTASDINSCQKSQDMLLCPNEMIWSDRNEKSCESSLFFSDIEDSLKLCDFHSEESEEPKTVEIENGVYHYSVTNATKVPVECNVEGSKVTKNFSISNNGFLKVPASCVGNINSMIIRNLLPSSNETVQILPDSSFFDIDEISLIKSEQWQDAENITYLNDEDILEDLYEKEEQKNLSDELKDVFQITEDYVSNATRLLKEHEQASNNSFNELRKRDFKIESQYSNLQHAFFVPAILCLIIVILLCISWYLAKNK